MQPKRVVFSETWKRADGDRPLHRMPADDRYLLLRQFVGQHVVLDIDEHRDGSTVSSYTGEIVSVALPAMGTVAELVVLRRDRKDTAFSGARVKAIRPDYRTPKED